MSDVARTLDAKPLRRFKPYPAYKGSGVEWLGEIPAHWASHRLKTLLRSLESGRRDDSSGANDDGAAFSIGGEHVGVSGELLLANERFIARSTYERMNAGRIAEGDVLLVKDGATIGKTAHIGALPFPRMAVNEHVFIMRPQPNVEPRFLYYGVASDLGQGQIDLSVRGAAQPGLPSSFCGEMVMPVAPQTEQRAIAAFLDRETARIDALMAKKERLIALLQEQRTALITRTVTKGLDPTVPMKDSGVEWLGEIPAHWEVKRLKHLLVAAKGAIKTGPFGSQLQSSEMQAGDIKVYNQRSVLDRDFSAGDNYVSLEKFAELRAFETFPGDLLITTRGSIGRCAVLPEDAERGILHPCLMRVQPDRRRILTRFLEIQIEEAAIVLDQLSFMSNATTIDVIYSESLREVWLTLPPLDEQAAIDAFLDRETARIDALVAKVRDAIERLKELRTALISAAVTGKIDVREEVA